MLFFTAVFFVTLVGKEAQGQDCSLTLQTDLDSNKEPLVLEESGKTLRFAWPKAEESFGVLRVKDGGQLLLACIGRNNYQTTSDDQTAIATCRGGSLTVEDEAVTKDSTACNNKYAASSDKVTGRPCGSGNNKGVIVEMGFQLENQPWLPLFSSCHKIARYETLYSEHLVHGASINGKVVGAGDRPKFSRGSSSLYSNVNPDPLYTKKKQEIIFNTTLGNGAANRYISDTNYLARGHLAPDADFVYTTGQKATYYFVNAAPQWQSFNNANWKTLENKVRSLAAQLNTTLRVWTGTYGVLSLQHQSSRVSTNIYLDTPQNRLPVPEVFWKLVQNPLTYQCTVAIGINNPFLTTIPNRRPINCKITSPSGWPSLTAPLKNGYVYYCSFADFQSIVDFLPRGINCSGGLL